MMAIAIVLALALLLDWALPRKPLDERTLRKLRRTEYRSLTLHIWYH